MKLILLNTNRYDDNSYVRVLYSLITRSVLNESRLNNDIAVENILDYDINYINSIRYDCEKFQPPFICENDTDKDVKMDALYNSE